MREIGRGGWGGGETTSTDERMPSSIPDALAILRALHFNSAYISPSPPLTISPSPPPTPVTETREAEAAG